MTFHWRGIVSSVSVTVSPSLRSRPPPQQRHVVGPRLRGRRHILADLQQQRALKLEAEAKLRLVKPIG
jgi:hypothetical protein